MINLILADDHAVIRKALGELLQNNEHLNVIAEAEDGEQLLSLLQNHEPDIIILDMEMPKLNGFQTMTQLKEQGKNPAVLILSADEKANSIKSALSAGAKGYLPKNVKFKELLFAIESIAEGRTYLSPTITEKLMQAENNQKEAGNSLSRLTKRELEILPYLANGQSHKEISKVLNISSRTVDTHRSNILKKLEVKSNAELVKLALANDIISLDQ